MHGFQKIPLNNFLLIVLILSAFLWGCGGEKETASAEIPRGMTLQEFLAQSEKNFHPSEYDPDPATIVREARMRRDSVEAALITATAVAETIPGFRVQVLFTQEIEQANSTRDQLSPQTGDQWVYVVFDSPYYKVRVGNFADRSDAGVMLRNLVGLGYKDAWIVPDNIIKNPPPKPPETFIVPEKR
jgi:hypothetical protein